MSAFDTNEAMVEGDWLVDGEGRTPSNPLAYLEMHFSFVFNFCDNMWEREGLTDLLRERYILKCASEWVTERNILRQTTPLPDQFDQPASTDYRENSSPPPYDPLLSSTEPPTEFFPNRVSTPDPLVISTPQSFNFSEGVRYEAEGFGGTLWVIVGCLAVLVLVSGCGIWRCRRRLPGRILIKSK